MMISTLNSQAFCSAAMQLFQSPPDNRGGPSFEEVVSRHDADGDGKLSIDEVSISEEAFAKADANGDGVIDQTEFDDGGNKIIGDDLRSQDEFPPMGPPPERASEPSFGEVVSRHDADGDGTLSIDELGCTEEAFAEADANGDGVIDQTEFDDGGNKIIGDDLRAQGPPSIPPESGTGNFEDVESVTGLSVYQWIQSILQSSSSESDASTIVNLLGSLNTIA